MMKETSSGGHRPLVKAKPVVAKSGIICSGGNMAQNGCLLAFLSQALKGKSLLLLTYEKELLALVNEVQKWCPYLLGQSFIIKTDQQSLKFLLELHVGTPLQQRWLSKLLGYDFIVEYKSGKDNKVADALSRQEEDGILFGIPRPVISWVNEIRECFNEDPEMQVFMEKFAKGELDLTQYTCHDGLLFYKRRFYLGPNSSLRPKVLQYMHESPLGGHAGYHKTLQRVKADFYWPGMRVLCAAVYQGV